MLSYATKLLMYRRLTAMPLDFDAVFSDESPDYFDGKKVRIRLRRGQQAVVKLCGDGQTPVTMQKIKALKYFDIYEAELTSTRYHFVIETNWNEVFYYNKAGIRLEHNAGYDFLVIPGFDVPEWAKGALMYQIFVDRFYNGDASNDVVNNEYAYIGRAAKKLDWHDPVENDDVCNFYGGDLQGVLDKLPYLKELGVEVIYFNPLFVSPSSHKYDAQDYEHIDPHFGVIVNDGGKQLFFERFHNDHATKYIKRVTDPENLEASDRLFIKLVEEAHKAGIKIIIDGAFNHCGAFHKWMDREGFYEKAGEPPGAYKSEQSPYNKFFRWNGGEWPDNNTYDSYWGLDNHPKLYFEGSDELFNNIMTLAKKWVAPPFNADGWRLDVARDLGFSREYNLYFWREFRKAVKEANPNAIVLAEFYEDPSDWLTGKEFDTIMNYDAFMVPVTWFLCGMQKHSDDFKPEYINNIHAFEQQMAWHMSRLPHESLLSAMNQLSNHDHSRFLTRTNRTVGRIHTHGRRAASQGIDKRVMYLGVLMQMTWPGAPCIYYGDEAGLAGWTDPDDRRPYPWGNEDHTMIDFHKAVISIRNENISARTGSLMYLVKRHGILCYARVHGNDRLLTVINNTEEEAELLIPVWKINAADETFYLRIETNDAGFTRQETGLESNNGFLKFKIQGKSGALIS